MLNNSDANRAYEFILGLVQKFPEAPVIAFNARDIKFSNASLRGNVARIIEEINDILSGSNAHSELGGAYIVCELEQTLMLLVNGNRAAHGTSLYAEFLNGWPSTEPDEVTN